MIKENWLNDELFCDENNASLTIGGIPKTKNPPPD
jgi:hypothetical protein